MPNFCEFEAETLPWIDRADWQDRLAVMQAQGEVTPIEAGLFRKFSEDGYIIIPRLIEPALCDELLEDYGRLWNERPACIVRYNNSQLVPISDLPPKNEASKNFRINDFHNVSEAAADTIMHSGIVNFMSKIFSEVPVAMQSLFFEYGSQQGAHQDFVYVPADILSHLAAAWIALEDISLNQGPLSYYPGSHRIKKYDFGGGCLTNVPGQEKEWAAHIESEINRMALKEERFIAKKGDVLIWHGALLHGGSPIIDHNLTRKSIVVHYSSTTAFPRDYRDRSRIPESLSRNGATYFKWEFDGHVEGRYKRSINKIKTNTLNNIDIIKPLFL